MTRLDASTSKVRKTANRKTVAGLTAANFCIEVDLRKWFVFYFDQAAKLRQIPAATWLHTIDQKSLAFKSNFFNPDWRRFHKQPPVRDQRPLPCSFVVKNG